MFEQSSSYQLMQLILDHPRNRDRDAYERQALNSRLVQLARERNLNELQREYDELPPVEQKTLPIKGVARPRFF